MKTKMFVNDVEASDLFDYVVRFYGPNGVYSNFFESNPIKEEDVDMAVAFHRFILAPTLWNHNGNCDSFDRELVCDLMFIMKGLYKPADVEHSHVMSKFFTPTGRYKTKYKHWMDQAPKDVTIKYLKSYFFVTQ